MAEFKVNSLGRPRTVKAEILAFVLPVVILGLLVLAGVIFKYTSSAFEEQLVSSSEKTTAEVADGVSDWLDARMLETQMTANSLAARGLPATQAELTANNELRLKLMEKDVRLCMTAAESEHMFMPVSELVYQIYKAAGNQGLGDKNYTVVQEWLEQNQSK